MIEPKPRDLPNIMQEAAMRLMKAGWLQRHLSYLHSFFLSGNNPRLIKKKKKKLCV